jgi:hypothetical protein
MMSEVRRHMRVTIDGTAHDVVTNGRDYADAEHMLAADGRPMASHPWAASVAVAYLALRRLDPHAAPATFDGFLEAFDDLDTGDDDEGPHLELDGTGALDPTHVGPSVRLP